MQPLLEYPANQLHLNLSFPLGNLVFVMLLTQDSYSRFRLPDMISSTVATGRHSASFGTNRLRDEWRHDSAFPDYFLRQHEPRYMLMGLTFANEGFTTAELALPREITSSHNRNKHRTPEDGRGVISELALDAGDRPL